MSWTILFLAGIFEIFWAVGLKYSDGFTKLFPTIFTIVTMIIRYMTPLPEGVLISILILNVCTIFINYFTKCQIWVLTAIPKIRALTFKVFPSLSIAVLYVLFKNKIQN